MLGKLIKHDFKTAARQFVPLFIFVILITPLTRFSFWFSDYIQNHMPEYSEYLDIIPGTVIFSYYATMIVCATATSVILIVNFYRSMVTREGYLTHTLPVTTLELISSKTIVSVIWTILSVLVCILSILILVISTDNVSDVSQCITSMLEDFKFQNIGMTVAVFIELLVLSIASIVFSYAKVFLCISIGQSMKDHKLLSSIGLYFAFNVLQRFIGSFLMLFVTLFISNFASMKFEQLTTFLVLPCSILLMCAIDAGLLAVTNLMFKKHLNLQ